MLHKKTIMLGVFCLLLTALAIAAKAQAIDYSFTAGENSTTTLAIKTSDNNVGIDTNTLEVTLNNKMRQKQDFTQTRIGEYTTSIPNEEMLDANKMTILTDLNQLSVDLNVVKDSNIVVTVSTMMLQETQQEQASDWLQQNAWQGNIGDTYIEVPNIALVGGIIALIALLAWKTSRR